MDIHLLDMGSQIYGDSFVVTDGSFRMLIDGGHMYDDRPKDGHAALQDQIGEVLQQAAPYAFDLLVVTHCHSDHIGCLPTLVSQGTITARFALLADPDLGYPGSTGTDALDSVAAKVVAGLREEPVAGFASDAELDQFLTDALNLQGRYRAMIEQLRGAGTEVILFGGVDDAKTARALRALTREFGSVNLRILGPTAAHLDLCTKALRQFSQAAALAASGGRHEDAAVSAADLYLQLTGLRPLARAMAGRDDIIQFLDRPGQGAALNDQSIVLTLGDGDDICLFTGDMQFAKAEIGGLDQAMSALLTVTRNAGPYAFAKLPHHASYNGFDQTVLDAWTSARVFAISTGQDDPAHPDAGVLALLKTLKGQKRWVRTDKNGLISLRVQGGDVQCKLSRGRLDDASPNTDDALAPGPANLRAPAETQPPQVPLQVISDPALKMIEVTARIPFVATKLTISIDLQPQAQTSMPDSENNVAAQLSDGRKLGGGRKLPTLLFVTNSARLRRNIGQQETSAALALIAAAGQPLLDVQSPDAPFAEIAMQANQVSPRGIVIVGGYDVLPPVRYGAIPDALRQQLTSNGDPDDFVVWSDQRYGDTNGDELGDLPVSRIPDGQSAELVMTALAVGSDGPQVPWFGLRNFARPFADGVFARAGGPAGVIKVSEPVLAQGLGNSAIGAKSIYFMLHGSDTDSTCFWGERSAGGVIEAVRLPNVPNPCGGTIFAGCCWGALAARESAFRHVPNTPHQPLTPAQSIALSFLRAGAKAFVGCTGAHYSPVSNDPGANLNYFGAPMHDAFWKHFGANESPAEALFNAKMDYIAAMPHGRSTTEEQAIGYKILRQFTCLGLGW